MSGAAFFDLDRTFISANSGILYARYELRTGQLSKRDFARTMGWAVLYHLSLLDIEKAMQWAIDRYRGTPEAEMLRVTREWFDAEVAALVQPGALVALAEHQQRGEPTVMLTNSSAYMAEVATARWGLDDWLANRFPVDGEGRLTGELQRPACYGAGKVHYAEAWAAERGVDLAESTFYTDSLSDVPMLERVGHPRVVNPDPRLKRRARAAGWPILDWR